MKIQRSLKEIVMLMSDEQYKQFQEFTSKYCEKKECEKCKRYLRKFEDKFLN